MSRRASAQPARRSSRSGAATGSPRRLRAARLYAGEITAVVSVADDGGSSGRLRELLGIPAPGDLRRCLGALLPEASPLGDALEHRFESGELAGHAFGNLLIAALAASDGRFRGRRGRGGAGCSAPSAACCPRHEAPVVLKAQTASRRAASARHGSAKAGR